MTDCDVDFERSIGHRESCRLGELCDKATHLANNTNIINKILFVIIDVIYIYETSIEFRRTLIKSLLVVVGVLVYFFLPLKPTFQWEVAITNTTKTHQMRICKFVQHQKPTTIEYNQKTHNWHASCLKTFNKCFSFQWYINTETHKNKKKNKSCIN